MRRAGLRARTLGSSSGRWERFWLVFIFFCFEESHRNSVPCQHAARREALGFLLAADSGSDQPRRSPAEKGHERLRRMRGYSQER